MLSRVAYAIYWMSRYIERAENIARFIDVHHHLMLDRAGSVRDQWPALVSVTGDEALFKERYGEPTRQNVTHFLTFDADYPNAIASCIAQARENARTIRETITEEMWEQVNAIHILLRGARDDRRYHQDPYSFYRTVKQAILLFGGIAEASMSRTLAWEFVRLGRLIERADKTSRIVDVKYFLLLPRPEDVGGTVDIIQWTALLRSTSALEMYRQAHGAITPTQVAAFLLLDDRFPRSLAYCVSRAERLLAGIAGPQPHPGALEAQRCIGRLRSELAFTTISEVIGRGMHEYLDRFQQKLNALDDAIYQAFFELPPPAPFSPTFPLTAP